MPPLVILGIVCGLIGAVIAIAVFFACRIYHHRKRGNNTNTSYRAIGDYTPPSLVTISSISSQEIQLSKNCQPVQPRSSSMSTVSRASTRSDQLTDETSSISAKSDTSADSVVFDANFGTIRPDLYPRKDAVLQQSSLEKPYGRLHIRLKYNFRTSDLVIHLIEAQDLLIDNETGFSDPYIKLFLYPEVDERVRQSSVRRKTLNPFYNEYFKFPITFDDLQDKMLLFHLYNYDKFSHHSIIGEVQVDLSKVDVSNSVEIWCSIQRHKRHSCTMGELLVSLNYLPTAERLTVVVMKAKDLKILGEPVTSDPFVRICLMVDGKKIKKKKTTIKHATTNPVWNEALVFNVPAEMLPKVTLECCVWDHDLIGHGEMVGKCVLGSDSQGNEKKHYNELIQSYRTTTAMWHTLHK